VIKEILHLPNKKIFIMLLEYRDREFLGS